MNARRLMALLILVLGLALNPAVAVQPDEILPDPALEARARALSAELRCLVCQNQSIDDSSASLARDLRLLVRERLKAGDTDTAVKAFLVARYGDFILLKPPFDRQTLLLWLTPVLALGVGVLVVIAGRAGRHGRRRPASLLPDEEARLSALLRDHPES